MNLVEQLGLFGVFLAGLIPWMEEAAVIAGILFGLDPVLTVLFAVLGNTITIVIFAYGASGIRSWIMKKREQKGKEPESPRLAKALKAFDKYGIYGLGLLGPALIGTQFAALGAVAAGVKPLKASIVVTVGMIVWIVAFAWVLVVLGFTLR
jgi:membrane protein YqaA with SNARE-associated domain